MLDIGGGQLAYLAAALWGDNGCVADVQEGCFSELREAGIDAFRWNLAVEDPPTQHRFDAVFFSEVIEHLPVPGHIALRRLRMLLRPGGLLLCSTPNLYRLRKAAGQGAVLRRRPIAADPPLPRQPAGCRDGRRACNRGIRLTLDATRGRRSSPAGSFIRQGSRLDERFGANGSSQR